MSIDDALIDRLSSEVGRRLLMKARIGRKMAIQRISRFAVTLTRDGHTTWEEVFDAPPTLEQIRARAGNGVFVVAVRLRKQSLRERIRVAIAAE